MASQEEIIDNFKVLCQCKGIKKGLFKKMLAEKKATTLAEMRKVTGAGNGSCQGRRCTPRIEELLAKGKE